MIFCDKKGNLHFIKLCIKRSRLLSAFLYMLKIIMVYSMAFTHWIPNECHGYPAKICSCSCSCCHIPLRIIIN